MTRRVVSSAEVLVPSVMGLLEERERAARQRVEVLQAELGEAEAAWERFVIACETVGQVLAEPRDREQTTTVQADGRPVPVAGSVPGSVVPVWREGLDASALAPGYQRIMHALSREAGRGDGLPAARRGARPGSGSREG